MSYSCWFIVSVLLFHWISRLHCGLWRNEQINDGHYSSHFLISPKRQVVTLDHVKAWNKTCLPIRVGSTCLLFPPMIWGVDVVIIDVDYMWLIAQFAKVCSLSPVLESNQTGCSNQPSSTHTPTVKLLIKSFFHCFWCGSVCVSSGWPGIPVKPDTRQVGICPCVGSCSS